MSSGIELNCQTRARLKGSALQALRRSGKVPGIVYGKSMQEQPVILEAGELARVFQKRGTRGIFTLKWQGQTAPAMALLREIQRDPVTGAMIHVDFQRIQMTEKMTAWVAVLLTGEEAVSRRGGIVQAGLKEIMVECLPSDLPENYSLDVSNLEIGDKMVVGDLLLRPGIAVLTESDGVLAVILPPSRAEEPAPVAEPAAENPAGHKTSGE
ncbi:MAG: 50S ribosomal protein L25 [Solirubrobacterales bacterium]